MCNKLATSVPNSFVKKCYTLLLSNSNNSEEKRENIDAKAKRSKFCPSFCLLLWETWIQSLGWGDSLEKGKATHSSILEFHGLYSPWGPTESDRTERLSLSLSLCLLLDK